MIEALLAVFIPLGVFAIFSLVILVAIAWSHEPIRHKRRGRKGKENGKNR